MRFGNGKSAAQIAENTQVNGQPVEPIDANRAAIDAKLQPAGTPIDPLPTAKEVGLDTESTDKVQQLSDHLRLAQVPGKLDGATALYTSHPIQNFGIGPFQFEKGILRFTGDEPDGLTHDVFENLLDTMPAVDRNAIRKIDQSAAERLIEEHRMTQGGATKQFDSGAERQAIAGVGVPTVGVEDISHAALPQTDNNNPTGGLVPLIKNGEEVKDAVE